MIVDLEEAHLEALHLQPAQAMLTETLADPEYRTLLCSHESFAGIHDGRVVGAAGAVPNWRGCLVVWALLADGFPRKSVHKAVKAWLGGCSGRVETWIHPDYPEHERWAKSLGFINEGLMHKFLPDGGDAWLYARF